jgi:hypothetical protein
LVLDEQFSPNPALGEQQSVVARRITEGVFLVRQISGHPGPAMVFPSLILHATPFA